MKLNERRIYSKYWNRLKQRRFPGYQVSVWTELNRKFPISQTDLLTNLMHRSGGRYHNAQWAADLRNLFNKKFVCARSINGEVVYEPTFHGMWVMFLKSKRIV